MSKAILIFINIIGFLIYTILNINDVNITHTAPKEIPVGQEVEVNFQETVLRTITFVEYRPVDTLTALPSTSTRSTYPGGAVRRAVIGEKGLPKQNQGDS